MIHGPPGHHSLVNNASPMVVRSATEGARNRSIALIRFRIGIVKAERYSEGADKRMEQIQPIKVRVVRNSQDR